MIVERKWGIDVVVINSDSHQFDYFLRFPPPAELSRVFDVSEWEQGSGECSPQKLETAWWFCRTVLLFV